jgi:Nucleoside-diphosphate-sugar epimerases
MRIAVTGGTGYLGRHLCAALLRKGWNVRLLGRRRPDGLGPGVEVALLDMEREIAPLLLEGCDALIHLAARVPGNHLDPLEAERCWRVNALGTLRLMTAAAQAGVSHIVHTTSGNAYARGNGDPRRESDQLMPGSRQFYLGSKVLQEIYAAQVCMQHHLPLATLRLASVYGGAEESSLPASFLRRMGAGQTITLSDGGAFGTDFVHVDDVVAALVSAVRGRMKGTYNVGSGERCTLAELAAIAARLCAASPALIETAPVGKGLPDEGFAALDNAALCTFANKPRTIAMGMQDMLNGVAR